MRTLKEILKTTPKYLSILEKNGIKNVKDFFEYFPRTHEDRSTIRPLNQLIANEQGLAATKGKIIKKSFFARGGKKIYDITFEDEIGNKGHIGLFNAGYLASQIKEDQWYIIVGKPMIKFGKIHFSHPEIVPTQAPEIQDGEENHYNSGRIYPIYPELNGIKPGWFAKKIWENIDKIDAIFSEYLPNEFLQKFNLLTVQETIKNIHYPQSFEHKKKATKRIFFDRLLRIQLYALLNKKAYQDQKRDHHNQEEITWETIKDIITKLPFELTNAQKKVIKTLIENFHEEKPMIRLLQGDVGSGKTIVATIGAYYHFKQFQSQSVFLAPLEVLANQHYKTLSKLLLPLGIRTELLTGSLSASQKDKIKKDLKEGKIHILIGTHAVLQENVEFQKLEFVVIDEQHKFGVRQRAFFKRFGSPHILQMSATPIPRSMALAFFGEFDVSSIDELPKGRKTIHTKIISFSEYQKLKPRILQKIEQGQKVFIITPLIEESEKMEELKAATSEFEETKELFKEIKNKIGILHGKMKPKEKEEVMQAFKNGQLSILVSTTVIEVGIDIPEATIMIIKNSERFGLSQLHQLRGRIGRSELQSYCFLETKKKNGDAYNRLKAMEETNDGFKLAEIDLQNRGAGEILGTMQSGESDVPIEILGDIKFIEQIQEGAKWLLERYPNLEELPGLKKYLEEKMGDILA